MNKYLSLSGALLLFSTAALAAPRPGTALRTRFASMEASYASGFYQPLRSAVLELTYSEEGIPLSMTLSVEGRKLTAQVWQQRPGSCGEQIQARLYIPDQNIATDFRLTDYSEARCRLYVKHKWHAVVSTAEPDGSESRLVLSGNP